MLFYIQEALVKEALMFKVGEEVSYGMHGRCLIESIETKNVGTNPVQFYAIRTIKFNLNNKTVNKNAPSILVPVNIAESCGMRPLIQETDIESVLRTLSDRDYFFSLNENWLRKQKILEETLRKEGLIGFAKVVGHLFVMIKKDPAPAGEVTRLYDSLSRTLIREFSEASGKNLKESEITILKAMRTKLLADN